MEGPLGHRDLYDWQDNQCYLGKRDRPSLHAVGHCEDGTAAFLLECGCPHLWGCRDLG